MSDGNDKAEPSETGGRRGRLDQAVDLCILAPIGLAADAGRLAPKLVEKGRDQVRMARAVGKFTVDKAGSVVARTLSQTIPMPFSGPSQQQENADEAPGAESAAPADSDFEGGEPTAHADTAGADRSPSDASPWTASTAPSDLAIPDYDSLSASQVVPRLDSLGPAELEAIRAYELSSRNRKTILGKINQLQHGAG